MEKALYAASLDAVKKAARKPAGKDGGGYSRVYYGAEFCQWRMPSPASALKAREAAAGAGLGFTLMTPWLTDEGIGMARAVLERLTRGGPAKDGGIEAVVNDFGLLVLLMEEFPMVVPVLGRLLVKQKCCPRIPGLMEGMPEAGREVYLRTGIEDPVTAGFFRKLGVTRVELDNPLQGVAARLKPAGIRGSIYTPYAYVTTTRHCPASFDGKGWQAFTGCRTRACAKNVVTLDNPAHEERLVMRGNTQFVINPALPDGLAAMGIDRVVVMEEAP